MNERKKYLQIFAPVKGWLKNMPSTMMPPEATPDCVDVVFDDGVVKKGFGTVAFGDTDSSALDGIVMGVHYVKSVLVVHTSTKVYLYNSGADTFTDVTDAGGPFTGDQDNAYSGVYFDGEYIWTNAIDQPRKWDLSGAVAVLGGTANYRPAWFTSFGSRLCLYNVTESSTEYPIRCRWSAVVDAEDYTSTGSGFADLEGIVEEGGAIQRAERIGESIAIYTKDSIAMQTYIGYPTNPFSFNQRVPSIGLLAPKALVVLDNGSHLFLGRQNIYLFDGRGVEAIGDPIRDELFRRMTASSSRRSFMVYLPEMALVRLFIPADGNTSPTVYFELNINTGVWSNGVRTYSAGGTWIDSSNVMIDDLIGYIDNLRGAINDFGTQALSRKGVYGNADGLVSVDDFTTYSLNGTAMVSYWSTVDFPHGEYVRSKRLWMDVNFEALGSSVDVDYSTDKGNSYTKLATQELTADWTLYELDFQVPAETMRVRFRSNETSGGFWLRFVEIGYHDSTDAP